MEYFAGWNILTRNVIQFVLVGILVFMAAGLLEILMAETTSLKDAAIQLQLVVCSSGDEGDVVTLWRGQPWASKVTSIEWIGKELGALERGSIVVFAFSPDKVSGDDARVIRQLWKELRPKGVMVYFLYPSAKTPPIKDVVFVSRLEWPMQNGVPSPAQFYWNNEYLGDGVDGVRAVVERGGVDDPPLIVLGQSFPGKRQVIKDGRPSPKGAGDDLVTLSRALRQAGLAVEDLEVEIRIRKEN